ncbi:MAG: tetratricopeptide repeat protein [Deltaproteobacteria bacterium]|nr:tetratricopeptide repeat protein [Deltaproteobacteria bacterium]
MATSRFKNKRQANLRLPLAIALMVAIGACGGQPKITKLVDGRLIETRSVSPRAYEHAARAMVYEEEDRYTDAIVEYKAALQYDPESAELYARLAEAYLALDDVPQAQAAVGKSLGVAPTVDGVVASAHIDLHRADASAAAQVLKQALALVNFTNEAEAAERVYLERADAQIMALQPQEALATLESLLSGLPTSQMGLYRQASVAWALGDLTAARRYLERLLHVEPDQLEARLLLARLLTVLGKPDQARSTYVEALSRSEGDLSVAAMYAGFLAQRGLPDEAAAVAEQMQTTEVDSSSLGLRMELERAAGRLPKALEMADAVLATQPGPELAGRILMAKGAVLEASHRPDEAARAFEAVPQDAPTFAESRLRAAALRRDQGQGEAAQALLAPLVGDALDESMQSELLVARALVLASVGKLPEARTLLLTSDEPSHTQRLTLSRAVLEDKYGDWRQALALSEAVLKKDLSSAEALNFWAFVAAEKKHMLPKALGRAQAALAFDPGSAAIMDTVGWIHMQMDNATAATPFLEGAAAIEPNDAEILGHVAVLYAKQGKTELASRNVTRALELTKDPTMRARLNAILKPGGK